MLKDGDAALSVQSSDLSRDASNTVIFVVINTVPNRVFADP
jgi:hypothetical protein